MGSKVSAEFALENQEEVSAAISEWFSSLEYPKYTVEVLQFIGISTTVLPVGTEPNTLISLVLKIFITKSEFCILALQLSNSKIQRREDILRLHLELPQKLIYVTSMAHQKEMGIVKAKDRK